MNGSKQNDPRFWEKRFASGAVAQQQLPTADLVVTSIEEGSRVPDHQLLWLGKRVVNSGPGWSISEAVYGFVVPYHPKHQLGEKFTQIPGNAIPAKVFLALAR